MRYSQTAGAAVAAGAGDLAGAGFPGAGPVWICAGDTEILLDDTRRMAAHLRAEGVVVTEVIARDLPHVWPMFQRLMPEADATLRQLAGWINSL